MRASVLLENALLLGALGALTVPLGRYLGRVYRGEPTLLGKALEPIEWRLYGISGVSVDEDMTLVTYALWILLFHFFAAVSIFVLRFTEHAIPAMLALTVRNFVWAASVITALVALVRALARGSARQVGSFWVDLVRTTLYVLLPLVLLLAVALPLVAVRRAERGRDAGSPLGALGAHALEERPRKVGDDRGLAVALAGATARAHRERGSNARRRHRDAA